MIVFLTGICPLMAAPGPDDDQDFLIELNSVKSPFDDGLPKPVPAKKKSAPKKNQVRTIQIQLPKLKVFRPELKAKLPSDYKVQGVIVGETVHQAIINGKIVPLRGTVDGAMVEAINKDGVELFFEGKKFFLKIE